MKGFKLVPAETNINFIGQRFVAMIFSIMLVVASIGITINNGLNFGIDFTGGTLIELRTPETPDLQQLRTVLDELDLGAISIQEFGGETDLLVRLPQQEGEAEAQQAAIQKVKDAIDGKYVENETGVDYRRVEFVGPQVGEELKRAGGLAILFSLGGILAYIWLRFEWQFGVAAIVALAHDAIATIGLFALTQMEFNLSTVAAVLMIAGYSINDTVVVFDRIRENLRKYKKKLLPDLFNLSVNQMLSRTLMTSVTTMLALIALWSFGGEVIRGFVDALIFGILIGTYSSVFVASPVLLFFNVRANEQNADETEGSAQQA